MPINNDSFNFVKELVHRESAILLEAGKEYLVEARLAPVARQQGHQNVDALVRQMKTSSDSTLSKTVVEALTTNETSFFRDNEPFKALKSTILPELATARATTQRIRVWSAACSSGQEVYSIAMTVKELPAMAGWRNEFVATDLSERMVQRTAEGRFNQLEMNRGLPAPYLVKYFTRQGVDWVANADLRQSITTRELNLNKPIPAALGRFDIIFLRNVLIYFDVPTKKQILMKMRQVLAPDGYLVMGTAESPQGIDDQWTRQTVGKSAIFRPGRK